MTFAVTKSWFEQVDDLLDGAGTLLLRQQFQHAMAEGFEPGGYAGSQRRGTWGQSDFLHQEALALQPGTVFTGAEKMIVFDPLRRHAIGRKDRQQGDANRGDITLAAAFSYEPATRLEGPVHGPENGILIIHPVQGRVGKDGVEFLVEGE
jgi:hypothetical protein